MPDPRQKTQTATQTALLKKLVAGVIKQNGKTQPQAVANCPHGFSPLSYCPVCPTSQNVATGCCTCCGIPIYLCPNSLTNQNPNFTQHQLPEVDRITLSIQNWTMTILCKESLSKKQIMALVGTRIHVSWDEGLFDGTSDQMCQINWEQTKVTKRSAPTQSFDIHGDAVEIFEYRVSVIFDD